MSAPHCESPHTELLDLWHLRLQQAKNRYELAARQFAEALEDQRVGLVAPSDRSNSVRQTRLMESIQEYLSVLRTLTNLVKEAPADSQGLPLFQAHEAQRRLARRYPVCVALEYRLIARGDVVETGQGHTVNVSSCGILFESARALPPQMVIQLCLAWPGRPSAPVAVELHVAGRTVRRQDHCTAVAIERHEFRSTRGRDSQSALKVMRANSDPAN